MSFLGKVAKGVVGGSLGGVAGAALALKHKKPAAKPVAPVVKAANKAGIDTRSRTSTVQPDGSIPKPPFKKPSMAQKTIDGAKKRGTLTGFSLR